MHRSRVSPRGSSGCAGGSPRWRARSSLVSVSFSRPRPPDGSDCTSPISPTASGPRRGTPPRRPWRCCSHHDGRGLDDGRGLADPHGREDRWRTARQSRRLRAGDRGRDGFPARSPTPGAAGRRTVRRRGAPDVQAGQDRRRRGALDGRAGHGPVRARARLPVLAPYRWLRAADPLPHSWEVTSDSIAAWLAGQVRARRVVLIKPAQGDPAKLVDSYFLRTLPRGVEHLVVTADDLGQLDVALREDPPRGEDARGGWRAG